MDNRREKKIQELEKELEEIKKQLKLDYSIEFSPVLEFEKEKIEEQIKLLK
jgi:hypothetical protein